MSERPDNIDAIAQDDPDVWPDAISEIRLARYALSLEAERDSLRERNYELEAALRDELDCWNPGRRPTLSLALRETIAELRHAAEGWPTPNRYTTAADKADAALAERSDGG